MGMMMMVGAMVAKDHGGQHGQEGKKLKGDRKHVHETHALACKNKHDGQQEYGTHHLHDEGVGRKAIKH